MNKNSKEKKKIVHHHKRIVRSSSTAMPRKAVSSKDIVQKKIPKPAQKIRKDAYGTRIERGGKKHKVSFVDNVFNGCLVEVEDFDEEEMIRVPVRRRASVDNLKHEKDKINCELCMIF